MRIGLVGTGAMANHHAAAIARAGARLVAVANHRAGSLGSFAARHRVARTYVGGAEELLDGEQLDGLVVATPNAMHAGQAVAALRAGVPVLIEKPMAASLPDAMRVLAAERASAAAVVIGHCLRHDPQIGWLRERIAADAIGTIRSTAAVAVHHQFGPTGWFTDPVLAGGGALVDIGVHAIDATRYVLGDPQPVEVDARFANRRSDLAVEDAAQVAITWSSGVRSRIRAAWWSAEDEGPVGRLRVEATAGAAETYPTRLLARSERGPTRLETPAGGAASVLTEDALAAVYAAQMLEFVAVAAGRARPRSGGPEGVVTMRILDAAYRSAATERPVSLAGPPNLSDQ